MQTAEKLQPPKDKRQTAETIAVGPVKDDQEYAAAVRKLDELEKQLKTATDKIARMELTRARYPESARAYMQAQPRMWDLSPEHIMVLAKMLIRTTKMPEDVNFSSKVLEKFRGDSDARQAMQEFDIARRTVEVLKAAASIQTKTVLAAKQQAIRATLESLRPRYAPIARRAEAAILELESALGDHREFCRQFVSDDPELARGFPRLDGDIPSLVAWAAGLTASKATEK